MSKTGKALGSFQELKQEFGKVPMLDLPEIDADFSAEEDLVKKARLRKERAAQVAEWVETALPWLDKIQEASQDPDLGREIQEMTADKVKETKESLAKILDHELSSYRRAAWLAWYRHLPSSPISDGEVKDLVNILIEQGYLDENPKGPIHLGWKNCSLPEKVLNCLNHEEQTEIGEILSRVTRQVRDQIRQERKEKSDTLLEQSDFSPLELKSGRLGKCAVKVLSEVQEGENGKKIPRGGGVLLVEVKPSSRKSDESMIFPLDASGGFERAVQEAITMQIFVPGKTLKWQSPPSFKFLTEKARLSPEETKKVQLLWHLLQNGIKAAEEKEQSATLRKELKERATISQQKFFLEHLETKEQVFGTVLVEFEGTWFIDKIPVLPNLFFLIEITEGKKFHEMEIVDMPEQVERILLGPCKGEKYPVKDDKFESVSQPLKAVLQATHRQAKKAAKIAVDTEAGAEVDANAEAELAAANND